MKPQDCVAQQTIERMKLIKSVLIHPRLISNGPLFYLCAWKYKFSRRNSNSSEASAVLDGTFHLSNNNGSSRQTKIASEKFLNFNNKSVKRYHYFLIYGTHPWVSNKTTFFIYDMKFFQLLSSSLRTFLRTRRSEREKLWNEIIIFQFRRIKSVIEKSEIYGRCCGVDLRLEHVWVGF